MKFNKRTERGQGKLSCWETCMEYKKHCGKLPGVSLRGTKIDGRYSGDRAGTLQSIF